MHVGFRDLPDLSATVEAGIAQAEIRGGTWSSDGIPPQVNAAVIATTLGFLAVMATVFGAIRRWLRRRRGAHPDDMDASPPPHGIDVDELSTDGAKAGEPTPPATPEEDPMKPLETDSPAPGFADAPGPTTTRTAAIDEANNAPPEGNQDSPQAIGTGLDPAPSAAERGRSGTSSQPTEGRTPSKEQADSRVVLFSATKWGG